MSKGILDLQVNKTICEAVGCFENATDRIVVKAGNLGTISLLLCRDCVPKFQEVQQT
jgi:hypothetical protein